MADKYDLEILRTGSPGGLLLPGMSGRLISGNAALVQRFLIELFTRKGSILYRPSRGTSFLSLFDSGITTESGLITAFTIAEREASVNLQKEESENDPLETRYLKSTIEKIHIDKDHVLLTLNIQSRADTTNVVVPLSI